MKQGCISEIFSSLSPGQTPEMYFSDLEYEIRDLNKNYKPFFENGIPYAWQGYVVKQYNFDEAIIKELEPYCSCRLCVFFRARKTCSIQWFYGFISSIITCPCCVGCLKSGLPDLNKVRIAYETMNKR